MKNEWTAFVVLGVRVNLNSLDNKGSCWILKDVIVQ